MIVRIEFGMRNLVIAVAVSGLMLSAALTNAHEKLEVLFVGNSYTGRHNLSQVVKAMAEERNPDLDFNVTTVIYGGRRLVDHWRLGTQNYVDVRNLTEGQVNETIASLRADLEKNPEDKYAQGAIKNQENLLKNLEGRRKTWDIVVLQSYRDDIDGNPTLYAEYAPKFTELAKAQGAKVVLYETSPNTQNAKPISEAPDREPVMRKEKAIAALAEELDVSVAPMSLIALKCQTERPDLTLRFINDAHLNHTMAYMTACAIYTAIFEKTPVGLEVDSITDIRYFNDEDKTRDRDGEPITRTFSKEDLADLQRFAWEGYREFQGMRGE